MPLSLQIYQEKGFNPEVTHGLCSRAETRFLAYLACLYIHDKNPRFENFQINNLVYCAVHKYPIKIKNQSTPFLFGANNYFIFKIMNTKSTLSQQFLSVGIVNSSGQKLLARPFVAERLFDCDLLTAEQQSFITESQSRISISNNQELFNVLLGVILGESERVRV